MNNKVKSILGILALAGLTILPAFLFSGTSSQGIQSLIASFGIFAPIAYIALFALLPIVFFPVAVLAVAGGLLFGLGLGSVYTLVGAAINCALMFLLSRSVGRKRIQALVEQRVNPVWRERLKLASGRSGFFLLIILRLIPAVPYGLINYAFGLSEMRFWPYMFASVIGIIPGTLVFINLGDKALDLTSPSFWIAIALIIVLFVVTLLLGKRLFSSPDQNTKEEPNV
ncbi:MAG: TVP38/TMEM64 family protein [Clostridiaceae bacterium]